MRTMLRTAVASLNIGSPWLARRQRQHRGHTALVIPVPEAEPAVSAIRRQYDAAANSGMPAHITLVYPFIPIDAIADEVEDAIRSILLRQPSFSFRLVTVATFPNVLYLAPHPARPFVDLTRAFEARWPDRPSYGGKFRDVVPHLTVAQGQNVARLATRLTPALPIDAVARCVDAMTQDASGRWQTLERFELRS